MRRLSFPMVLAAVLAACTDDPFVAPIIDAEATAPPAARVWFTGSPEVTAALALMDSVMAQPDLPLVIIDGIIQQAESVSQIPRDQIRTAMTVRATTCVLFGPARVRTVLLVTTAAGLTPPERRLAARPSPRTR